MKMLIVKPMPAIIETAITWGQVTPAGRRDPAKRVVLLYGN